MNSYNVEKGTKEKSRKHKHSTTKKHSKHHRGSYDLDRARKPKKRKMSLFVRFLVFIRFYFDYLVDYIFGFFLKDSRKFIPKIENPILVESATILAKKVRERNLKSEDLVRACIKRIQDVNPVINAVVNDRFSQAIEEAVEIDRNLDKGVYTEKDLDDKPFLGVPFTTKETTSCKGLRFTFGLKCRENVIAEEDAEVIALMKKAGGILLGNTNIPQLNLWSESYNPIYGMTCNPYDTSRISGGSSGGEGSIIAACGSPMGIGTDIGGSIRIPCYVNGIYGHKPTADLVSTKGLTLRKGNEGPTMVTAGAMCRSSKDIIPMLKVLLAEKAPQLKLDTPVNKIRVFYCSDLPDPMASKTRPEIRDLIFKAAKNLTDISIDPPKEVQFPNMRSATKLWTFWMSQEPGFKFRSAIVNNKGELNIWKGLYHYLISREYYLPVVYYLISTYFPKKDPVWAKKLTEELRQEILELLGEDGVLLFPSSSFDCPYHYTSLLRPYNATYTAIFNVLKLPVTQVPLGLNKDGVPTGIQIVTSPYKDYLSIAAAKYLEENFAGYVPPCEVVEKS